jgi:uncharacterized repeat protein (TIGR01451 family)
MRKLVSLALAGLLAALATPAAAQGSGPGAQLSVSGSSSNGQVLAGASFDVTWTVSNSGNETAPDPFLSAYLPPDVEIVTAPDACTTDAAPPEYPTGTKSPPPDTAPGGGGPSPGSPDGGGVSSGGGTVTPGYYGGGLYCQLPALDPTSSTSISVTFRRVSARAVYVSASVWSSAPEEGYDDNYTDLFMDADTSRPADIGLAMDAPQDPGVGDAFSYELTVSNSGPSTGEGIRVVDPLGYGVTFDSVAPARSVDSCSLDEVGVVCDLAELGAGSDTTITIGATRTSAWDLWNNAWITSYNYDENYDNDYAWHQVPPDPSVVSDLALSVDMPPSTPLVGETFGIDLSVANDGPSTAGDVSAAVYLPPELELVSSSNDVCKPQSQGGPYPMGGVSAPDSDAYYPIYMGGISCSLGAIASGTSKGAELTVSRTGAREAWVSAWVSTSNSDPNYDNNYADLRVAPDKSNPADVALSLSGPSNPQIDSDFDIVLTATNDGPSTARDVHVTGQLPWGAEFVSTDTDACVYSNNYPPPYMDSSGPAYFGMHQLDCTLGDLDSGSSRDVTVTLHRTSEYEMWSSGWISTSNYDPNADNDYASMLTQGKSYGGECPADGEISGTKNADDVVVGDCTVETGGGSDSVALTPGSGSSGSSVNTGAGSDTIAVRLGVGSNSTRPIVVSGGPGADRITVTVAPGAGGARVTIDAGSGNDAVVLSIPAGLKHFSIHVKGKGGSDRVEWTAGTGVYRRGMVTFGGGGRDVIVGGPASDEIFGGKGVDHLYGGPGRDQLDGGPDRDVCRGGPALNHLSSC